MRFISSEAATHSQQLRAECAAHYGASPDAVQLIRAPYRLCPLGAHIDHQLGPVSAIAVNQGIDLAFLPNDSGRIEIVSQGFPGTISFAISERQSRTSDWADYARGAVQALRKQRRLSRGVSMLVRGHLSEAGISSSAAVGLAYLLAIARVNELTFDDAALIELDRVIENEFLGLKNGVLDQSAIALARSGRLSIIDCRELSCRHVAQPDSFVFLAVYSGLREALVNSNKFNSRVEECLLAGAQLSNQARGTELRECPLGELSVDEWQSFAPRLPTPLRRRADHFFAESQRVAAGARAWEKSDSTEFGRLMTASGMSSIHNYETGSPEMIRLYEVLNECGGVHGARFSGAGFRGCAVALIERDRADDIAEEVEARYLNDFPQFADQMWAFASGACDGLALQ